VGAGWALAVYPEAGEAGGSFRYSLAPKPGSRGGRGDPERSAAESARRSRRRLRRYCAANGLNRLGTLTYAGEGCHDPRALRGDLGSFFRALRTSLGGEPFAYAWVAEWHKGGHGLHAHFAVGQYIAKGKIKAAWGRGHVHIKLLGDLPVGSGVRDEARVAARYLSKYIGKDFDGRPNAGRHRYDLAQGFKPRIVKVSGPSLHDALDRACEVMGGRPVRVWQSGDEPEWHGPPVVSATW
jgi:hypothetical protein